MLIREINQPQRQWYHGTSDRWLPEILRTGLAPGDRGKLYLTTNAFTAQVEAFNTSFGDLGAGLPSWPPRPADFLHAGTGGEALVLTIDPEFVQQVFRDPEYPDPADAAYFTRQPVPAQAIIAVQRLGTEPPSAVISYWLGQQPDLTEAESAGKKDACYRLVRSRVKIWPSAYASGQLVQCRKRGASNWGKGSK